MLVAFNVFLFAALSKVHLIDLVGKVEIGKREDFHHTTECEAYISY
jgi:hypothetical protein